MVDIQSAMAETRRGKKKRKKEQTTGQKYTQGGHNNTDWQILLCIPGTVDTQVAR